MSNASIIYDTIIEKLEDTFSEKTRIPNPYVLADNNDNLLRDGVGLVVGSASFEPFEFCNFVVGRTFTVVFTREMVRLDSSHEEYDTMSKLFLEDVYELQKLFFNYNELGIEANILKVDIVSSSEVSAISDKNNFYSITAEFNFSIKESF
jgi:hypothetical protein